MAYISSLTLAGHLLLTLTSCMGRGYGSNPVYVCLSVCLPVTTLLPVQQLFTCTKMWHFSYSIQFITWKRHPATNIFC